MNFYFMFLCEILLVIVHKAAAAEKSLIFRLLRLNLIVPKKKTIFVNTSGIRWPIFLHFYKLN